MTYARQRDVIAGSRRTALTRPVEQVVDAQEDRNGENGKQEQDLPECRLDPDHDVEARPDEPKSDENGNRYRQSVEAAHGPSLLACSLPEFWRAALARS
jgi:hypothetical protein